jgi:two-component system, chemotaxis family, CheB/CheR fusion protein
VVPVRRGDGRRELTTGTRPSDPELEALLDHVRDTRGFDFTGYKRPTLQRRVAKRLQTLDLATFSEYVDHLEVHPEEFDAFFDTILINVTAFLRDPEAWAALGRTALRAIADRDDGPVRVWSAGCSSGEEAYTLAVLLAEALGHDAFRDRVKIYGTDVDDRALATARAGSYPAEQVLALGVDLAERYFRPNGNGQVSFRPDLRRSVIFGRHDVVNDAPISRLDLLVCRNMLMYFNGEAQARIVERFHFALRDDGFLFLGKAETLTRHGSAFAPVDAKCRIFAKNRLPAAPVPPPRRDAGDRPDPAPAAGLHEASFDAGPVPQVVVAGDGTVAGINAAARRQFRLAPRDVGMPLQDLEVSYRPADLRSLIDVAYAEHRIVGVRDVEWPVAAGASRFLDVEVVPLFTATDAPLGVSVTFTDVTRHRQLVLEVEDVNRQLEMAYEELQSTNEELETTNEELQSTIEELETTNEELQSTNEELETMNEELQSTNDELHSANEELRRSSDELNEANVFLEAIVASIHRGVIVVDRDLRVRLWNERSTDLWGLGPDEVRGVELTTLDFGLPLAEVRPLLAGALAGHHHGDSVVVDARTRRGYDIRCRVACQPLADGAGGVRGAILVMEDVGTG